MLLCEQNEMQDTEMLDQMHVPDRVGTEGESPAACLVIHPGACSSPAYGNGKDMVFSGRSLQELAMPVDFYT